jgi:hypothetical protein
VVHWPSAVQPPPPAAIFAAQAPEALQYWVVGHGAVAPHAPAQVVGFAHRLLGHEALVPGRQTPVPSHVGGGAAVPLEQVVSPQVVVLPA